MLRIENLTVELKSDSDHFYILRGVSLGLKKGEILGMAGESGSGKSVLAKSILGINPAVIKKTSGDIYIDGKRLESESDYKSIRGKMVSMIFQNPTSSLNHVMTIGAQLIETLRLHDKKNSKSKLKEISIGHLKSVEIDKADERIDAYPHQLSGGMNQRVMIALALASNPALLIADEPTTALDVTIQAQIIRLISKLNKERGLSTLFISHDLSLLERISDRVAVLYSGELMEIATAEELRLGHLKHPYTKALKSCIPEIGKKSGLTTIKGSIAKNDESKNYCCIFAERCDYATEICFNEKPLFNGNYACHNPFN